MKPNKSWIFRSKPNLELGRASLRVTLGLLVEVSIIIALCSVSFADYQGGASLLFTHTGWDYAPTNFIDNNGTLHKFWWCGEGTVGGIGSTDVIYYRYYSYTTQQWSAIYTVLTPTPGSWEDGGGAGTCNPSVIKGSFSPGNGNTYSYALYYVAQNNGSNRIGVAFSNDGITWTKYAGNPIVYPQVYPVPGGRYGAGEPSTYSYNGGGGIDLFQYDDSVAGKPYYWWRSSSDGIHFSTATPISMTTQVGPSQWPTDIGYDYNTSTFYAVIGWGANDGQTSGFGIYKAPASSVLSGTGTWNF